MIVEKLWTMWKQKRCDHHYKKHWSRISGKYVMKCTKCGKEQPKEPCPMSPKERKEMRARHIYQETKVSEREVKRWK